MDEETPITSIFESGCARSIEFIRDHAPAAVWTATPDTQIATWCAYTDMTFHSYLDSAACAGYFIAGDRRDNIVLRIRASRWAILRWIEESCAWGRDRWRDILHQLPEQLSAPWLYSDSHWEVA